MAAAKRRPLRALAKPFRVIADTQLTKKTMRKIDAANGDFVFIGRGRHGRTITEGDHKHYYVTKVSLTGRKDMSRTYFPPDGRINKDDALHQRERVYVRPTRKRERERKKEKRPYQGSGDRM